MEIHHATTVGPNDGLLNALLSQGIQPRPSSWLKSGSRFLQKDGWFANSHPSVAQDTAFMEESNLGHKAMIVTVDCDFSPGWEIDFEESPHVGKFMLARHANGFGGITSTAPLDLPDGSQITRVETDAGTTQLALDVTLPDATSRKLVVSLTNPYADLQDPQWQGLDFAEIAVLQVLRDYLVVSQGQSYLSDEKLQIERIAQADALDPNGRGVSMKYTHPTQALPITRIEIFQNGQWEDVPLPAAQKPGLGTP